MSKPSNELNEIKKVLYKEKPIANIFYKGVVYWTYFANTSIGEIQFKVPVNEMGEFPFSDNEQSQLLIRWIV